MAQTLALIQAAFPAVIAGIIDDYFRPKHWMTVRHAAEHGIYEFCAVQAREAADMMLGACRGGHKEIVKLAHFQMLRSGAPQAAKSFCLYNACRGGNPSIINFVCTQYDGQLYWIYGMVGAAKAGNLDLFRLMRERRTATPGGPIGPHDRRWLLNSACRGGNMVLIGEAESLCPNTEWFLKGACKSGLLSVVRHVSGKGAKDYDAGLISASKRGFADIVSLLLVEAAGPYRDAMAQASRRGHIEVMRLIIKKDPTTIHALRYACSSADNDAAIQFLMDNGANDYDEGLMGACENGVMSAAITMVARGATNIRRAAIYALENEHDDIAAYLMRVLKEREQTRERPVAAGPSYREVEAVWRETKAARDSNREAAATMHLRPAEGKIAPKTGPKK